MISKNVFTRRLFVCRGPYPRVRIKEFVRCINTTEPQTIQKGWEKTRLTEGFDFDKELENEDAEEEFLLHIMCYGGTQFG